MAAQSMEGESLLRGFYDGVPVMMGVVRLEGDDHRVLSWNKATSRFLGVTPDEARNRTARELGFLPEQVLAWNKRYRKSENMSEPYVFEETANRTDQTSILSGGCFPILGGPPDRFGFVLTDISEQRKSQEALRESEKVFRTLARIAPIGIYLTDTAGACTFVNAAWSRIAGLSPEEAAGYGWTRILHPEDKARIQAAWDELVAKRTPFEQEYRFVAPSGKITWVLGQAFAMEEEGKIKGYLGTVQDTEDKRALDRHVEEMNIQRTAAIDLARVAEKARAKAEKVQAQFRSLLEAAPDAMVVLDPSDGILISNRMCHELFGYSREELIGQPVGLLLPGRFQEALKSHSGGAVSLRAGIKDPSLVDGVVARKQDGKEFPVEVNASPSETEDGLLVTVIIRDVSERREFEFKLEHARIVAEEANQAKSRFLANMSHEIRTPLNGILGMTTLMLDTVLTEEQRNYAQTVQLSGDHLLTLINQILDFSKIGSDKLELEHVPFSPAELVENALQSVMERAQKKGLELITWIDGDLPRSVLGDPLRVKQVLINILSNAVKFSDRGEILVTVHPEKRTGNECLVKFEISDQGQGMSGETLHNLFTPFLQGDESLSRRVGGTGLGLAISKDLVNLMGGEIKVESTKGKGSRFSFTLGFQVAAAEDQGPSSSSPIAAGYRLLLADPNPGTRKEIAAILLNWGFDIQAVDADEALRLIREASPMDRIPWRLALLSLRPDDGESAGWAEEALQAAERLRLPVLFSLPFIAQSQGAALLKKGATAIVMKPYRPSQVLNCISTAVPELQVRPAGIHSGETTSVTALTAIPWNVPPNILVADDHPVNLDVASSMLRKLGCQVDVVPDGNMAVAAVARKTYDVIFMDCQMPDLDGFQATARIRSLSSGGPRLPIIALTAHAVDGDRERCLAAGMDGYISKPFSPQALRQALREWIPHEDGVSEGDGAVFPRKTNGDSARLEEQGPIDWERLDSLVDNGPEGTDLLAKLILLFEQTTRSSLNSLQIHLDAADRSPLPRILHRMKGSCATMGARTLAALTAEMEEASETEAVETLVLRHVHMEGEFRRAMVLLRESGRGKGS